MPLLLTREEVARELAVSTDTAQTIAAISGDGCGAPSSAQDRAAARRTRVFCGLTRL
jgi:hypothetical protein